MKGIRDCGSCKHRGFADHEYQAARTFFDYYAIEQPSTPLLVPEFQKPLFLKILCCGLRKSGLSKIPKGLKGITAVFKLYIDAVNSYLADDHRLGFNPNRQIVWQAIDKVAALMAERQQTWLQIDEVEDKVNSLLPNPSYEKTLYRTVVEGLLSEDIAFKKDEQIEVVRFPYEKFSDQLIVKYLLDEYLDDKDPQRSFTECQQLSYFTREGRWIQVGFVSRHCAFKFQRE